MNTVTDYERVATIVWSGMRGTKWGEFGRLVPLEESTGWQYRVELAGCGTTVLVRTTPNGELGTWQVQFKGFIGEDRDLEEAARLALEGGKGNSVSRNYKISA